MGYKGLKFLLIFSPAFLILSKRDLRDIAQSKCKKVGKFKENFRKVKLIGINQLFTS
ncbi:hypothetical protein NIES4074_31920 [Cylindrospermum sp. NIES-4074]|nr:hypothetical protein NIES4074_31920 [Cylindrospermum sp. NIES-4074]